MEERPEEAAAQRQKEEAANMYDTFDMRVDRHWSEKKVSHPLQHLLAAYGSLLHDQQ